MCIDREGELNTVVRGSRLVREFEMYLLSNCRRLESGVEQTPYKEHFCS